MKILLVHGYYQERGGEDAVFEAERDLLRRMGHEVETFTLLNADAARWPKWRQLLALFWNARAYRDMRERCERFKPDVVHAHNLFPFLSPSVLLAARRSGAKVVATLHNYRVACANGLFLRNAKPCERCAGKWFGWPAVRFACYRGSRVLSLVVVLSTFVHRLLGSWKRLDALVAPSAFAAQKIATTTGLSVGVKPHFLDEDASSPGAQKEPYALFIGRYSEEKGVLLLLEAWKRLRPHAPGFTLHMVGDGPLKAGLPPVEGVVHHGHLPQQALGPLARKAAFVVIPSLCYETMSRVVMEAFAAGTAVIAPSQSAPGSLVRDGVTGRIVASREPEALVDTMLALMNDSAAWHSMGRAAHAEYLAHYSRKQGEAGLEALYGAICSS